MRALLLLIVFLLPVQAFAQPAPAPCTTVNTSCPLSGRIEVDGVAANGAFVQIPPNAVLREIVVQNTAANAVTGGVNVGYSATGADVVSAQAVGASGLVVISGASLLATYYSATLPQSLYISAASAWNGAVLNVRFFFDQ